MDAAADWNQLISSVINVVANDNLLEISNVNVTLATICDETTVGITHNAFDVTIDHAKCEYHVPTVVKTLLHELVHIEQYQTKALRTDVLQGEIHWMGNIYDFEEFEYEDMPWEIAAEARAEKLYKHVGNALGM